MVARKSFWIGLGVAWAWLLVCILVASAPPARGSLFEKTYHMHVVVHLDRNNGAVVPFPPAFEQ